MTEVYPIRVRAAALATGLLATAASVYLARDPLTVLMLSLTAMFCSGLRIHFHDREYETVHTLFLFLCYWYGGVASGLLTVPVLASGSVLGAKKSYRTGLFHISTMLQALMILPFSLLFPGKGESYPSAHYLLLVPLMHLARTLPLRSASAEGWNAVAFLGFLTNVPAVLLIIHATSAFGPEATGILCTLCVIYLALVRRETLTMERRTARLDRLTDHNSTIRMLLTSGSLREFAKTAEARTGTGLAFTEEAPGGPATWTSEGLDRVRQHPGPDRESLTFRSDDVPGLIITATGQASERIGTMEKDEARDFMEQLSRTWQVVSARIHQEEALFSVALLLARIADLKDRYTKLHSLRVAGLSMAIGEKLALSEADMAMLKTGALLHDIGKVALPSEILGKKGILTSKEREVIRSHPREGAALVSGLSRFSRVAETVLHHHERLDGSGYPSGLKGDAIPLHSRIVAVADTFDAITAYRPYHPESRADSALKEIQAGRGTLYDARVVDALAEIAEAGEW